MIASPEIRAPGQLNSYKTRDATSRNVLDEPARDKGSRRIGKQITCGRSGEPEMPRGAERLKNGKASHALEQVEDASQHSAPRTKKDGDEQYTERLTGDRDWRARQRDRNVSAEKKQNICGGDAKNVDRNAFAAKNPTCDRFRGTRRLWCCRLRHSQQSFEGIFLSALVQRVRSIIPEGLAASLRLFAGDEGIFERGYNAVFVVAVDSSVAVEKKRAVPVRAIFLGHGCQFEFGVVAVLVGIDSISVDVAVLLSGRKFGADQGSLFG